MNTICMNWTAVAPPGQRLAQRAPFSLARRAQGSAPGPPLSRHPASVKRVNRVEERKLLPESETLWGGPQALRAHHNLGITADYIHGHLGGIHTLSLARDVREHHRGEGRGDIDRSKPLKLTNHRSIRHHHHHRLSLFPLLSLCQLSVSSLSLSTTHQAMQVSEGAASASSVERALTWPAGVN